MKKSFLKRALELKDKTQAFFARATGINPAAVSFLCRSGAGFPFKHLGITIEVLELTDKELCSLIHNEFKKPSKSR